MKNITLSLLAVVATLTFAFTGSKSASFKVDTKKSTLGWLGKKVTGEHSGNISLASGSLEVAGKNLKGGSFEIDMNTITCTDLKDAEYNGKLVGHLKADDFFGVAKFPKASFVIGSVKNVKGDEHEVTGKLTIKGITQEIKFPATIKVSDKNVSAVAKITVNRTKYDIKYGSGSFFSDLGDKTINDDFTIDLNLVAVK